MRIIQIRIDYERDDDDGSPAVLGDTIPLVIGAEGPRQASLLATVKAFYEQNLDDAKVVGNIVLHPHIPREGTH